MLDDSKRNNDKDKLLADFDKMREKGIKPSVVSYNILLDAFAKVNNIAMRSEK